MNLNLKKTLLQHIVIGGASAIMTVCGTGCAKSIDAGQRAVKLNFGAAQEQPLQPGLHWRVPFAQKFHVYNVKTLTRSYRTDNAKTADMQKADVGSTLIFSLDPERVVDIYKTYGSTEQLVGQLLDPIVHQIVQDTVSKYEAQGLIENREKITKDVLKQLQDIMKEQKEPIQIKGYKLADITFDKEFQQVIAKKAIAKEQAEVERHVVEQMEAKKEQQIVEATAKAESINLVAAAEANKTIKLGEAEAEVLRKKAEAINDNPDMINWAMVNGWKGEVPSTVISSDGNKMLPVMDLSKIIQDKQNTR